MSLVSYQNYTRPFASLGQYQNQNDSWIRRNWPLMLQILGLLFMVGGTVARQLVERSVPKVKIPSEDWELLIQAAMKLNPGMSREKAITQLCTVFGDRAPFCLPAVPPPGLPAPSIGGIPTWMVIAGLAAAGYFLFIR